MQTQLNQYRALEGCFAAIVTPLHSDGSLDIEALQRYVAHLVNNGIDGIVACGTTAEALSLSLDEKIIILQTCKDVLAGAKPLIAGVMSASTHACVQEIRAFNNIAPIDAYMCICPYFSRPYDDGIKQHFIMLAENAAAPIMLYNNPMRSAWNMSVDLIDELALHNNITYIKECADDLIQRIQHFQMFKHIATFSGLDQYAHKALHTGANGIISVLANIIPDISSISEQDWHDLLEILCTYTPLSMVKAFMATKGIMQPYTRLPNIVAPYKNIQPMISYIKMRGLYE